MVRLKAMVGATMQPDNTLFQFHYGTIKSQTFFVYPVNWWKFQFHYGTIKSLKSGANFKINELISIPLWYD